MFTRESISKELKRIQDSYPKSLVKNVNRIIPNKVWVAYNTELNDPNTTEENKKKIRIVLETIKPTMFEENHRIGKMLDEYFDRQYNKAVKEGRLPTREEAIKLGFDKLH